MRACERGAATALALALALHAQAALAGAGIPPCDRLRMPATPPTGANLVLVVNDTLRPDRMGAYGGAARTPSFDAFAAANLLFARAVTNANWTKPAIATLFTGLLPSEHGLMEHPKLRRSGTRPVLEANVLGPDFVTLAEILQASGFRTGGFVANAWLARHFGFSQGFDTWDDSLSAAGGSPGPELNEAVRGWLAGIGEGERFFAYVHYVDTHRPYGRLDPAEVAAARERIEADPRSVPVMERSELALTARLTNGRSIVTAGATLRPALVEMAYHRGIENFDRAFGDLIATLAARPDWSRTAVVVTSDHGEALFDRGYGSHGRGLYQDEVAVPLAARLPGLRAASRRIDCPTALVDVMPTLCDYLGTACPEGLAGASLLGAGKDGRASRFLIVEGVHGHPDHRAVVGERYKLIHEPNGRAGPGFVRDAAQGRAHPAFLYDLRADPGETTDLLAGETRSPEVEAARVEMMDVLDAVARAPRRSAPTPAAIDPELARRLRALGYLTGNPGAGRAPDTSTEQRIDTPD
jgi:arylsulfatase